jgi:hypothetical protein
MIVRLFTATRAKKGGILVSTTDALTLIWSQNEGQTSSIRLFLLFISCRLILYLRTCKVKQIPNRGRHTAVVMKWVHSSTRRVLVTPVTFGVFKSRLRLFATLAQELRRCRGPAQATFPARRHGASYTATGAGRGPWIAAILVLQH